MSDLEKLRDDNPKNNLIFKLLKSPNHLLATILIANNFINVAIVIISAYLTSISFTFPKGSILEFVFQVIIITALLVLFGEITPKIYANNKEKILIKEVDLIASTDVEKSGVIKRVFQGIKYFFKKLIS